MSDNYWEQPHYLEKQEKRKRDIACASELLKRVADAIRNNHDKIVGHKDGPDGWVYYIDDARAAIAAVAEWLEVCVATPSAYITADNLREQLEATA